MCGDGISGTEIEILNSSNDSSFGICGVKVFGYETETQELLPGIGVSIDIDYVGIPYVVNS